MRGERGCCEGERIRCCQLLSSESLTLQNSSSCASLSGGGLDLPPPFLSRTAPFLIPVLRVEVRHSWSCSSFFQESCSALIIRRLCEFPLQTSFQGNLVKLWNYLNCVTLIILLLKKRSGLDNSLIFRFIWNHHKICIGIFPSFAFLLVMCLGLLITSLLRVFFCSEIAALNLTVQKQDTVTSTKTPKGCCC